MEKNNMLMKLNSNWISLKPIENLFQDELEEKTFR